MASEHGSSMESLGAEAEWVEPPNRAAWRVWLAEHHPRPDGVWLVYTKKGATHPTLSYDDAVEEALCFGWIDSIAHRVDEDRTRLWFAPRKKGSVWAASNRGRVERLIAQGLMMPPGLAKIEAAKADGSWDVLVPAERLEVPADLLAAFERFAGSRERFEEFPASTRRFILEWVVTAKRPATRAKRVEETARLAAQGIRVNEWRARGGQRDG